MTRTLADAEQKRLVIERVTTLSPADERLWGRMTAEGMVCHIADAFRFSLGEVKASEASGLLQRTLIKRVALYAPMKWPRGVPTRPEFEQGIGGTMPGSFDEDRARVLELLDRFCADDSPLALRHPIFGKMTRAEWMRWGYLHTDHHLRQFGR